MSAPRRLRLLLLPILLLNTPLLHAKDNWMSLQTRNFLLVGNSSEGSLRNVAMKFEQFRDTFSRLFKMPPEPPYPGTIIVFKNESSFRPFKPLYQGKPMNVGGFYAAGPDVNYIALCLETSDDNPYHVIYHEYVHQLLNGFKVKYPLWLNEGLAEYYGTFAVTDGDKKVLIGKPVANHILFLRENKLLPLQTLFTVDPHSPFYNEKSKLGVFYAQSWALVHYLMLGNPQRHKEFVQLLNLQLTQVPLEESFRQAFGTDFSTLEKELDRYIQRLTYPMMEYPFEKKMEFDTSSQSRPLSESEVQFYLGDLLRHNLRDEEAEAYLKRAIELDPQSAPAYAALGMLYLKQHQPDKAKESFAKAIQSEKVSYLVHYYYAQFLVDDESRTGSIGGNLSKEKVQTVRAELKKAISLAPKFPESYALLAYVNLTTGEELDESIQWVNTAKKLAPGKERFDLLLAQLLIRKEDYKAARPILERLASQPDETGIDLQAQRFLEHLKNVEEQQSLMAEARRQATQGNQVNPTGFTDDSLRVGPDPNSPSPKISRKSPAAGEKPQSVAVNPMEGRKVEGVLTHIECPEVGVIFIVKSVGKTWRFSARDPMQIFIYNETGHDLGTMTMSCGPFSPQTPVVVTYKEPASPNSNSDGEVKAIYLGKKE